ncbi:unnamed protein product [Notodromas monacha]|uniref:COP9 signalosome complex subunit 3 n=1 Tax=Notodromas monacha TaxID=399045 RepID=A0A7R9BCV3_9CRUS|nr:unnamed protein product [Notodromas monacha]CAG0913006.1 unnamed protein product [Notodromas monacha]
MISGNLKQLTEYLGKSADLLSKHQLQLDSVLQTLDLQQHSLGILAILLVKFNSVAVTSDAFEPLFVQFHEFILGCNGEQIRFAADSFAELCHLCTEALTERRKPAMGIPAMKEALIKLQSKESQLTSIHSDLLRLCLLARNSTAPLHLLEIDIDDINRENGQMDPKYVLLYYYYGGMIYATRKNWENALFMLSMCITTPAMAVSHIMLEAYKKHMLISLIHMKKIVPLPKYTSGVVNRFFKHLALPYHDLATAFSHNDSIEFEQVMARHSDAFVRDQNMGLVKQCLSSLHRKNIQRLTMTFMTLSLEDMANRVKLSGPQEAERYVLEMIEDGDIYATIHPDDGMVEFQTNPENYESMSVLEQLKAAMEASMHLENKVQKMSDELSVNPDVKCDMADSELKRALTSFDDDFGNHRETSKNRVSTSSAGKGTVRVPRQAQRKAICSLVEDLRKSREKEEKKKKLAHKRLKALDRGIRVLKPDFVAKVISTEPPTKQPSIKPKERGTSTFTDEDFEKFEEEYFVPGKF